MAKATKVRCKALGDAIRAMHGLKKMPEAQNGDGKKVLNCAIHALGVLRSETRAEARERAAMRGEG